MSHLSERTLGLAAIDPELITSEEAGHLKACAECRSAFEAVQEFDQALREPESWIGLSDDAPPARNDELRAFAVRAAREDADALVLLDPFKESSAAARFVWENIARKPEYRTGGVARLLCRWANGMCERDPLYALKLAEAATAISRALPDESYPRKTIHDLRGEALKEQANAFLFLGRLPEALSAVAAAEAEYRKLPHESIGFAAVKYLRGAIHDEQGELEAAEFAAAEAADAALRFGTANQYMNARYLLGHILLDRQEFAAAAEVFEQILRQSAANGNTSYVARASLAVGICELEVGRLNDASRYLEDALRLFTSLAFGPDVTRTNCAIARLRFAEGNAAEAMYRLRRCMQQFTEYQMITDAALAAIDLAEILNATGRQREIPKVLANTVQTFTRAGKLTSALTALAYLKDAAAGGAMTPTLVAYVRRFVQRADKQPDLLFAPPPPSRL